jgi:NADH-quinone oxidoreductase subunit F
MPEDIDLSPLSPFLNALAPQGRTALLPILYAAQDTYGYIPPQAVQAISARLGISAVEIDQVIASYALLLAQPVGKTVIRICNDPVCANAGAEGFMKRLSQQMDTLKAEGKSLGGITIEYVPCLGLCEHAPAVEMHGARVARADTLSYDDLVEGKIRHPRSIVRSEVSILTSNCGKNQVTWLVRYLSAGGYAGLRKALELGPTKVLDEIKASGLIGRGGAGFPTGMKWESAAQAEGTPKYVVCNAGEAEPGSFKDRVLIEDDPHRVLEGMVIAGFAVGATKGYLFVRGEYLYQINVMIQAIEEARKAGYLGEKILGSAFCFDIEIRRGAGGYVGGEETAVFKTIEGYAPVPSARPPFPTTHGLFGMPTVVNNVETLVNVPYILRNGTTQFRKLGSQRSPGTKLFSLSGDVTLPGLYEVPFGITLRHLIYHLAGGIRGKRGFQAALIGGAAGAFANEHELDIPLTYEDLSAADLPLGSGVITVFDETRSLQDVTLRLARFFAAESCGKCEACSGGTWRQSQILERLADGKSLPGDREKLLEIAWTKPDVSICRLGQTAAQAVQSALRKWPNLFA